MLNAHQAAMRFLPFNRIIAHESTPFHIFRKLCRCWYLFNDSEKLQQPSNHQLPHEKNMREKIFFRHA
jgi:hypothetical protein